MAWGFTFAGTDMVDVFVEETNPADPNQTRYKDGWEPMTIIREEIKVKGEAKPRTVELKFTQHGPVFYEDPANHRAFAAKSVEPGAGHGARSRAASSWRRRRAARTSSTARCTGRCRRTT